MLDIELLLQSIGRRSNANKKYFELGINIYELSQRARDIYLKADRDDRRRLLTLMFENLYLDEGKISYELTLPFKLVFELSEQIRSSKIEKVEDFEKEIFEPEEKIDISVQTDAFYHKRPVLLCARNDIRKFVIANQQRENRVGLEMCTRFWEHLMFIMPYSVYFKKVCRSGAQELIATK
ncbi:MAG: hypothetical protein KatS3mg087_0375 [Patescibacteria group bacterium]|nr:MAG: hypothetical protein KatS3mg087_0375 [Patescibacteria group bacterium]